MHLNQSKGVNRKSFQLTSLARGLSSRFAPMHRKALGGPAFPLLLSSVFHASKVPVHIVSFMFKNRRRIDLFLVSLHRFT